jgi:hypothetical protein
MAFVDLGEPGSKVWISLTPTYQDRVPGRRLNNIKIAYFCEKRTELDIVRFECKPLKVLFFLHVFIGRECWGIRKPPPLTATHLRIKTIIYYEYLSVFRFLISWQSA